MSDVLEVKENWLDRLDKRLAALSQGSKIDSSALYQSVKGCKPNLYGKAVGEVSQSEFALEMARRVSEGKIQAEFDGRTKVIYSPVEPS